MSNEPDLMVDWLQRVGEMRPQGCTDLSDDLLNLVGRPPVPSTGLSFSEKVAHKTAIQTGLLWSTRSAEMADRDRRNASQSGNAELADDAAQRIAFWSSVERWFQEHSN